MMKITNRKKQAIETKLKITKTAMEFYKLYPSDQIKVTDICEAANVSVGAFYHHFESKDSIIAIAYQSLDELIVSNIEEKAYPSNLERCVDVFLEATRIIEEYGYSFVASAYKVMLTNFDRSTFSSARTSFLLIQNCIEQAIEEGEIKPQTSAKDIAEFLMATGRGVLFDWCLHKGGYDLGSAMEEVVRFNIAGLKHVENVELPSLNNETI